MSGASPAPTEDQNDKEYGEDLLLGGLKKLVVVSLSGKPCLECENGNIKNLRVYWQQRSRLMELATHSCLVLLRTQHHSRLRRKIIR